jgi:hypothetical protein
MSKTTAALVAMFVQTAIWVPAQDAPLAAAKQPTGERNAAVSETQAMSFLSGKLQAIVGARQNEARRGVAAEDAASLAEVVDRFPGSKASHRALYLIGNMYYFVETAEEMEKARPYLSAVTEESDNLIEAGLARFQLLLMGVQAIADQKQRRERFKEIQGALTRALPQSQTLDKQQDDASRLFRQMIVGRGEDLLTPRIKLDLSAAATEAGDVEQAMSVLGEVIDDYPNTIWARSAERRLKTLRDSAAQP